jgi:hypothetical protein
LACALACFGHYDQLLKRFDAELGACGALLVTRPEVRNRKRQEQRETESPFYARTRLRARFSCNRDEVEATTIERMRRIDDFDLCWRRNISVSRGCIPQPPCSTVSIGGCRSTRGGRKQPADRNILNRRTIAGSDMSRVL